MKVDLDLNEALRTHFGYESFQPGQEEVIRRVLDGKDKLAILATGAGKSLCYQLPALLLPGTTVVVSPLIALMKDQIDMLAEAGISSTIALNSTLSDEEEISYLERVAGGTLKLIYVTPERLEDESFVDVLKRLHVGGRRERNSGAFSTVRRECLPPLWPSASTTAGTSRLLLRSVPPARPQARARQPMKRNNHARMTTHET